MVSRLKRFSWVGQEHVKIRWLALPATLFQSVATIWQLLPLPTVELVTGPVDIYHTFDWFHLPSRAASTSVLFDLSTVVHPEWHGLANIGVQRRRLTAIRKRCEHFFCISERTSIQAKEKFKLASEQVSVTYLGVERSFTLPTKTATVETLHRHGLAPGYFLFVGTLEPRKNLERLLLAYATMRKTLETPPPLVIAGGEGWKSDELTESMSMPGVHWTGYVPRKDLPALYRGALGLVYPSLYEGFGLPVLEAMYMGCPVITSLDTSMAEIVAESAFLVDPESEYAIAQAMLALIKLDPKDRKQIRREGRNRAESFTYSRALEEVVKIWRSLSGEKG
jgi:alpha-1,3-rhamnosyl/mannosyltransferase